MSALALMCLALTSGPAFADWAPHGSSDHLYIHISGYLVPKCELHVRGAHSIALGQILDPNNGGKAAPVSGDLTVHLECNAPYTAYLTSKNGGLVYNGAPIAGFSSLVGYTASVTFAPTAGGVSLRCDSSHMHGNSSYSEHHHHDGDGDGDDGGGSDCHANSGHSYEYSEGTGDVKVTLKSGTQPLLAGEYSDQLTLRVTPNV